MASLVHQRCFQHSLREAVARCPECRHFYCRECITEHADRVICATCLRRLAAAPEKSRRSFAWLAALAQFTVGFCIAWLCFYFLGTVLLSIPSRYHEGSIWIDRWWNTQ
jgi:hypothetical protein